jgi:Holliday junction resolvasome RuvABC endonuclease subunit
MNIQLADVTLHIDENLDGQNRTSIEDRLRSINGVVSVHNPDERPHLVVVEYNPAETNSQAVLKCVTAEGVHAELIGL